MKPPADSVEKKAFTLAQNANFTAGFATSAMSYERTFYATNWYDALVEQKDGEFVPSLATDWKVSDDGLTYTLLCPPPPHFMKTDRSTRIIS